MDGVLALRMPWIWDWTANAWAATAAWATFGVAVLAALFARHQVLEARRTREEQAQPFVVVDFEPSVAGENLMNLVIRNTGTTIATAIKVQFTPPLQSTFAKKSGEYDIGQALIIREGIPTLPPGKTHTLLFDSMPALFASDLPRVYEAEVSFFGPRGQPYDASHYKLDLNVYFGVMYVSVYNIHHAAKAVMSIEKTINKWTTHFNGIRVYARDEDAMMERQRREYEEQEGAENG